MPVFGSDSTVLKEGWLWKQGKKNNSIDFLLKKTNKLFRWSS